MPPLHTFTEAQIQSALETALQEVFLKLLRRSVSPTVPARWLVASEGLAPAEPLFPDVSRVVGSVRFHGEITGLLQLEFELDFAARCASQLHEQPWSELDESAEILINDAVGEITGMTVGRLGVALGGPESPCRLSLPSIVRGHTIQVEPIRASRHFRSEFACEGSRLVADVFLLERAERAV